MFTSELCPYLTDSAASRMLMAIIPAERYVIDHRTGINLTLQTACQYIVESFNRLGVKGCRSRTSMEKRQLSSEIPSILYFSKH